MARAGLAYGGGSTDGEGKPCITRLMDRGTVESHRYFLARRTAMEMLRDRGYDVADSHINRSLAEFGSVFVETPDLLERLRFSASFTSQPSKKILVIFCGTSEIRKQAMKCILFQISQDRFQGRVILILQSKMNSHARKLVAESTLKIETFHIADLLVNLTKHVLVPKLEILTAEENQKLLKKFNVEAKQIPRLMEVDPIAKYYGLEKGQMVKVTYNGPQTGSLITYRCVV